ncbi:MAG: NUDIX hydrolase [Phycisphaerae bacterium]|nr:NUDIX hydrolase [Phycisphaerae bacterium]
MANKIENESLIHKSYLFEVRRLQLRTSAGEVIHRDVVRHPGAAIVVPVLDDGSIVMIHNYRYAADGYLWELPCGTLDNGEDPLDCAVRELKEETGYSAPKSNFTKLGKSFSCPGYDDEIVHSYLATGLTHGAQQLEDYEDITVEVMSDAKVRRMIADSEIVDAKSIAALTVYWLQQNDSI